MSPTSIALKCSECGAEYVPGRPFRDTEHAPGCLYARDSEVARTYEAPTRAEQLVVGRWAKRLDLTEAKLAAATARNADLEDMVRRLLHEVENGELYEPAYSQLRDDARRLLGEGT